MEPNLSVFDSPESLKWQELVDPGTPLPTPWPQEAFETEWQRIADERQRLGEEGATEEVLDDLVCQERELASRVLGSHEYTGTVGAFEGAGHHPAGLYRPTANCVMFTRDKGLFCPVCQKAIERAIRLYIR